MAVAFDAASGAAATSVNHTASGTNRLAMVKVGWFDAGVTVSGVTYGGNAMTAGPTETHPDQSNVKSAVFYLINPPTGSQSVAVTYSGGTPSSLEIDVTTFTGAHQSSPPDDMSIVSSAGDVTTISNSADGLTANDMMWASCWGAEQPAVTTVGTQRLNQNDGFFMWAALTNTGTGTVTGTWTHGLNKSMAAAARIIAAGGNQTKVMSDDIVVADANVSGAIRPRTATESVSMTDQLIKWTRRYRLLTDTLTIIDEVVKSVVFGSGVFVKVMSDTLSATDGFFRYLMRRRDGSEVVAIVEGDVFRTAVITASENVEMADGFVQWRRLKRLLSDNVDLIDGFSKTIAGAGITYARILSDTVTLVDDAGNRWRLRMSQLTDAVGLNDQVVRYLRRIRQLGDDIEYSDGTLKIQRLTRFADDTVVISDEEISTLVLYELSPIEFRFGASGPPFRFGGV